MISCSVTVIGGEAEFKYIAENENLRISNPQLIKTNNHYLHTANVTAYKGIDRKLVYCRVTIQGFLAQSMPITFHIENEGMSCECT